ncbi:alpha-E domain-containing protein [Pelagicoccus sp. SDUM812003]|uniref:alpha-E domain-containing protein n=1 Tax=Pelagicoccus sp. SDUM812003 TaxID=3041267 RepID=UPI00280C7CC1|nr:alpha-E domain-containing protein [Pelagicoccus sp. SDUM812003]MDQ8204753.1 alpha-E domain-containing protein [Pelagicoccus sp. SDUM812003]
MLCRVADSLFWMSRYIERAENTVRLVDVTLQTLLESESQDPETSYIHWSAILASLGDLELFESLDLPQTSQSVTEFLSFNRENPSSVFNCIAHARENARMIRDQISSEMWETINRLYLYLKKTDPNEVCGDIDFEFFETIKQYSLLFQGITETTFPHKLGYEFISCGLYIERADKTCRILDAKRYMPMPENEDQAAVGAAQWSAILKGCSAFDAYHQEFVDEVRGPSVRAFLMLSREFPRSVLYCLRRLQGAIHAISGCPITHFQNEAERRLGMLISRLNYATAADLERSSAKRLLSDIEDELAAIAIEISDLYMFSEIVDPALEVVES